MSDKRAHKPQASTGAGTKPRLDPKLVGREPQRPPNLPDFPADDGPTTGAIHPIPLEKEDPALNRDNDRGSHRAH